MNLETLRLFLQAVLAIFAVVDVIGGLPVFIAMTDSYGAPQRKRIFRLSWLIALAMVCGLGLAGKYVLQLFDVRFEALMFGGGLLLIIVAINNILERAKTISADDGDSSWVHLAVSPLAYPMLAGPGAFVTVMLLVEAHGPTFALAAVLTAFALVLLILTYSHLLVRVLGTVGTLAVGRVMNIFIVAIGVNFCITALLEVFPGLAGS